MAFIYGVFIAAIAIINWHADTQIKKVAVLLVISAVSLIFGGLAAQGV